jgi:hypothetical protein
MSAISLYEGYNLTENMKLRWVYLTDSAGSFPDGGCALSSLGVNNRCLP